MRKYQTKCGVKARCVAGLHGKEEKKIRNAYRDFCERRGLKMGFNRSNKYLPDD